VKEAPRGELGDRKAELVLCKQGEYHIRSSTLPVLFI
jgi:hypothetical protein